VKVALEAGITAVYIITYEADSPFQKILPSEFGFRCRMHESHQMNSTDQVNTLLNYGYAILESQLRKAQNIAGLDFCMKHGEPVTLWHMT
jgi:CRISPR/Cas system-associated endonuclease Cas1